MDLDRVFTVGIFFLWIISKIWRVIRNKDKDKDERPARPALGAAVLDEQSKDALVKLRQLLREADRLSGNLTGAVRRRLEPLVESREAAARELTESIEDLRGQGAHHLARGLEAESEQLAFEIQEARELVHEFGQLTRSLRDLVGLGDGAATAAGRAVGEAVVETVWAPFAAFASAHSIALELDEPLVLIADEAMRERLRSSPLAAAAITLPSAVGREPWRWSALGFGIGNHLFSAVPELHEELYERSLSTGGDAPDPADATARVLFTSWLPTMFADACGALLFGASYLRGLAAVASRAQAASRVLAVRVTIDGTVTADPPAHMRVHFLGRFLTRLGEPQGGNIVGDWDARHGQPTELRLIGGRAGGAMPIAPLLAAWDPLVELLFDGHLEALGGRRLRDVPGFDAWPGVARYLSDAGRAFAAGRPFSAEPQLLVAAAIAAALDHPAESSKIAQALESSVLVSGSAKPIAAPHAAAAWGRRSRRAARTGRRSRRAVVEALLLAEVLLERPRVGR